jgi:hypothetical protein
VSAALVNAAVAPKNSQNVEVTWGSEVFLEGLIYKTGEANISLWLKKKHSNVGYVRIFLFILGITDSLAVSIMIVLTVFGH